MLTKVLNRRIRPEDSYLRLVVGSAVVALLVALGTVGVAALLGIDVNAAIPAALSGVAAATYAAAVKS